ncbi:MAG: host attachment protein [Nitrospirae bacterium]|nr:host attachment protein [Nitrospirota bacterium]
MSLIIITVDLGHLKAYRVTAEPAGSPKIELIKTHDSVEGLGKLGGKLSDIAGRFTGGGGKGEVAKGYGEPHHLVSDIRKKLVKTIAADMSALITKEDCKKWHLAAGGRINKEIVENLEPKVKSKLDKNITLDLTKTPKSGILAHFK